MALTLPWPTLDSLLRLLHASALHTWRSTFLHRDCVNINILLPSWCCRFLSPRFSLSYEHMMLNGKAGNTLYYLNGRCLPSQVGTRCAPTLLTFPKKLYTFAHTNTRPCSHARTRAHPRLHARAHSTARTYNQGYSARLQSRDR